MNTYRLLSGQNIEYPDPSPPVARFLARVRLAANDPNVSLSGLIELIYGPDNPLLDNMMLPGRSMVTKAVFANPVYHVMADQIGVKEVQLGLLDMNAARECYTLSVPQAAKRLGITPSAVRSAINAHRLAGMYDNGQWWIRPESVDSYKVSTRGPKRRRQKVRH